MTIEKKLKVGRIEKLIGLKSSKWKGNCYSIAKKILDTNIVKGKLRYGHWLGKVKKGTMFDNGIHFQRHGWIELKNGIIVDATRWVFEGVKPYIFIGKNKDNEYDIGGQTWRKASLSPPPEFDNRAELKTEFSDKVREYILNALGYPYITKKGLFWIANLPVNDLIEFAKEIYTELDRLKMGAFIPIDNYRWVME